jgi:FtsP/CotA-like multicopper oxidase with cupredoxin domain
MNRRDVLLGAVSIALARRASAATGSLVGAIDIPEPTEIRSDRGRLDVTLEAKPAIVTVAGKTFRSNVFNGQYVAPVLVIQRGEEARIRFVNNLGPADVEIDAPQLSNFHAHGMAISPNQPGDNVYFSVASGFSTAQELVHEHASETPQSFSDQSGLQGSNVYEYRWRVPPDHAQGLHWYHPHAHGYVEQQILSGLSGLLIVDGFIADHYPELAKLRVRRLLLKDGTLPDRVDGTARTKTINGVVGGVMRMRPGEHQIWEIGNVGADAFFDLSIDGHDFFVLGHDGNILVEPHANPNVFLPPGARAVVVVRAGAAGSYRIWSRFVDTGPAGDPNPTVLLAHLVVEGTRVSERLIDERLRQPADNRLSIQPSLESVVALPVTRRRKLTFSESADGNSFFIDGREFDPQRDDITVRVGDVEEWTLLNETSERHVFHIHQLDFLVISINQNDVDARGLRDVIDMPYAVGDAPGIVKIKIPFTNPAIVGRFPFHCHILEHEDRGMMANVNVLPRS